MLPILYILFNRPDRIEQSFAPIRRFRPPRLYLAADGPRPGAPDDPDRCLLTIVGSEARVILEVQIDDLWKLATTCRDAVKRHEEEQRVDRLAAEAVTA